MAGSSCLSSQLSEAAIKVSSIFVYPIKSCRGISVPHAPLTPTGFRWDRQWMIVNYKRRGYTQRVEPKLSLIDVELPSEAFIEGWEPSENSYLVVKAPGMDVLKISLIKTLEIADGISVWEWSGSALDEGPEAANWFSDFLGKPSRLVRFNAASETRPTDSKYAPGHQVLFADAYPYLLLSQGTMDAINKLLKEPIPANRFRPNILVDGIEPFSEDLVTEIRINKFIFQGVKLCVRCKIPSINHETGIAGPEPTQTLMRIRSDKVLRPTQKPQGKTYLGMNLVWKDPKTGGKGNVLKVGDEVNILKKIGSVAEAAF